MENMIFANIPSYNWEYIEKRGKKLAKYGVEVVLKEVYVHRNVECISIEIIFPETLEQGNWEFLGLKVAFEETFLTFGNVPNEFKNNSFRCDHCHSDRYRKSVVIIKNNDNGEIKQVGKTCLDKYLNSTLKQFSSLLLTIDEIMENALMADENDFFGGYSIYHNYINVEKFLFCAYTDIMARGYHKRDSYEVQEKGIECTVSATYTAYAKFNRELTQDEKDTVKECKQAYTDFIAKKGTSDFSDNVLKLLSANYIESKYNNMIVFVPTFLINSRKFEAEKKAKQEKAKEFNAKVSAEYIGEIEEKINIKATLIHYRIFENCWDGYHVTLTNCYTFMDEQGHLLQWKTQTNAFLDPDRMITEKKIISLQGTVKEHKEFKERYYTILTRCKVA